MAFDFPDAPTVGDIHTAGGVDYQYAGNGVWNLASGGMMTDYVLKAGDTMIGPLAFDDPAYNIDGGVNAMNVSIPAGGKVSFMKDGVELARIGDHSFVGQGNIYAQGGGKFIFNNTDNNAWQTFLQCNGGIFLQYHQGGNNDGRFRLFTSNGGYSDAWVMETTIVSGQPGIVVNGDVQSGKHFITKNGNVYLDKDTQKNIIFRRLNGTVRWDIGTHSGNADDYWVIKANTNAGTYDQVFWIDRQNWIGWIWGSMSASSFIDRGAASTKADIRDCADGNVTAAFAALRPKRLRKFVNPDKPTEPEKRLRFGFVSNDLLANPATKDIVLGEGTESEGTDIMQVLALTVAKLKLLEAEVAALKGGPKAPTPTPAPTRAPPPAPRRR